MIESKQVVTSSPSQENTKMKKEAESIWIALHPSLAQSLYDKGFKDILKTFQCDILYFEWTDEFKGSWGENATENSLTLLLHLASELILGSFCQKTREILKQKGEELGKESMFQVVNEPRMSTKDTNEEVKEQLLDTLLLLENQKLLTCCVQMPFMYLETFLESCEQECLSLTPLGCVKTLNLHQSKLLLAEHFEELDWEEQIKNLQTENKSWITCLIQTEKEDLNFITLSNNSLITVTTTPVQIVEKLCAFLPFHQVEVLSNKLQKQITTIPSDIICVLRWSLVRFFYQFFFNKKKLFFKLFSLFTWDKF
jgi:hypothetical protein